MTQAGYVNRAVEVEGGFVRLPLHRVSWAHIDEPEEVVVTTGKNAGKKKNIYRYTAWIPGDADIKAMEELFKSTRDEKWSKGVPAAKRDNFIFPYRKATDKDYATSPQLLEMRDNAGGKDPYICNLKSHNREPGLRKMAPGNKVVHVDKGDIYSGCWALATVNAYAYDGQGSTGVAFSLQSMLKVRDDSQLGGGGTNPDVDYADVDMAEYGVTDNELLLGGAATVSDDLGF